MSLSINEKLRQEEITGQKTRDKEARFQQLQLLTITICIPIIISNNAPGKPQKKQQKNNNIYGNPLPAVSV